MKRSFHTNIYGNVIGYESGKRVREFGAVSATTLREAKWWTVHDEEWRYKLVNPAFPDYFETTTFKGFTTVYKAKD